MWMLEFVVFRKSKQLTKIIHAGHKNNKHFFQQMFFNIMISVSIKLKMHICSVKYQLFFPVHFLTLSCYHFVFLFFFQINFMCGTLWQKWNNQNKNKLNNKNVMLEIISRNFFRKSMYERLIQFWANYI